MDYCFKKQVADGAALVVLNDDGEAIRMPMSDQESTTINIPSVMTSKVILSVLV